MWQSCKKQNSGNKVFVGSNPAHSGLYHLRIGLQLGYNSGNPEFAFSKRPEVLQTNIETLG